MNNKQNDYDERLKYRVGRVKLLIAIFTIIVVVLAYIIIVNIPKTDGEDPLYFVEGMLWIIPMLIIIILTGTGELGDGKKTASEWSSFMIAQFLKERDRKKELNANMKDQQISESNHENIKEDDWSDF